MIPTRFIFTVVGTRGDVLPLLAIAKEVMSRGHSVHVLANDWAAPLAQAQSLPFTTIAPTYKTNLGGVEENFGKYVFPSYAPTFRFFESERLNGSRPVVVNLNACSASSHVCELDELPLCRLVTSPFFLPSTTAPSQPWASYARRARATGVSNQNIERALGHLYEQQGAQPFILKNINEHRQGLGLGPLSNLMNMTSDVYHYIGLFPHWYTSNPVDWPQQLQAVGFPLPAPQGKLAEPLQRFLTNHPAPLVFAPGTAAGDTLQLVRAATECCGTLGHAGIILGACAESRKLSGNAAVLHVPYAELGLLLKRARLLVHHGGIGTAASALQAGRQAGVPQLISPQAFDQPDNAERIVRLGVGGSLPRHALNGATLTQAVGALLDKPVLVRNAQKFSKLVAASNGIVAAADSLLQRFAASSGQRQTPFLSAAV